MDRSDDELQEKSNQLNFRRSLSERNRLHLSQLDPAAPESIVGSAEGMSTGWSRNPEFIKFRSQWNNQQVNRRQEQQVDDVRCMFNMVHSVARPVLQQDASMLESTVTPRTADQLLLDLQQLGLVRAKGGPGIETGLDSRTDQAPILKDIKLVQEIPFERPVFHCFFKELTIDKYTGTHMVTIEQVDDAFIMVAYHEPSDGETTMAGIELARFPKFPQITDGFCMSDNGDTVVFTCTLLGCVVSASLGGCAVETDPALAAAVPETSEGASSSAIQSEAAPRMSSLLGFIQPRDNISNSSQSSIEAAGLDQMFRFQSNRVILVTESNYKLSEPISEHVYDVCIREVSNAANSGSNRSTMYVTNKTNIAVISTPGLKLDNFLFEGLRLPWRLKLHRHLLIIAEKWGSVQIADLEKEHRSLCVTDMQDLCCENGLKSIEIVPEHNLLLLTVYPEGNQSVGRYVEDAGSTTGSPSEAMTGMTHMGGGVGIGVVIGGAGSRWNLPSGQGNSDGAEEASWSCHCFHFNPESTHGNPMLRYAQTLRMARSPLTIIHSETTKRLYVLSFHPSRNNSALLVNKLEVFHEERVRSVKFSAKQLLPQKDEEEYKSAVEGVASRTVGSADPAKLVEMFDLTGSPVVAMMKAPMNLGFK